MPPSWISFPLFMFCLNFSKTIHNSNYIWFEKLKSVRLPLNRCLDFTLSFNSFLNISLKVNEFVKNLSWQSSSQRKFWIESLNLIVLKISTIVCEELLTNVLKSISPEGVLSSLRHLGFHPPFFVFPRIYRKICNFQITIDIKD